MGMQHACLLLEHIGGRMSWRAALGQERAGTKTVAVKLESKKVDWRLSEEVSMYKRYWVTINECESILVLSIFLAGREFRITVYPVIIVLLSNFPRLVRSPGVFPLNLSLIHI